MSSPTLPKDVLEQVKSSQEFFDRSTRVLEEADSTFAPKEGMMTVAHHVTHAGQSALWFLEGATSPNGFDLNFEEADRKMKSVNSLAEARKIFADAFAKLVEFLSEQTADSLAKPLPAGPIMGGEPVVNIFWALIDHTAHHRGALTVYSRLLGKVPVMPYAG